MKNLIKTVTILSFVVGFAFPIQAIAKISPCVASIHVADPTGMLTTWQRKSDARAQQVCEELISSVRETLLSKEPDLRDEVYTTILWLRLDAEAFLAQGNYYACISAMLVVKQLAGFD